MKRIVITGLVGVLVGMLSMPAQARIKLTTLPERETVRVDIKNGRFTLVEEERTVNLQQGRNQVDFSWANIGIDKDSIVFRVIKADGDVNVLNTNYPNNENALYWTVSAAKAGPAVIRISYLIGNMSASASYQGIVENDEKSLLLQTYMTVQNTSGEDFGRCTVQPGVGKTTVRYFKNGERKRMLASKFTAVPIQKRFVFDAAVDQKRTRMYYRLLNDKENNMGQFPLPRGKVRLFIKEPKSDDDSVRSQAFLGEDWGAYTPLFAKVDLYVGVAQDVKVERFTMQPKGGPRKVIDELTCPRILMNGERTVTHPRFRHQRTRFRYRLQNFKTANGEPIPVPLTIQEHVDGEWIIENVEMKEILGERNDVTEKVIPHEKMFLAKRIDVNNVEFEIALPPTTIKKKYDLYVTVLRKNRRHNVEPIVYKD
ncbi:MAG: hypothetical protein HN919_16385 [Verrucomicrobia bacterium]|jgi:hypothetical protein|nr:hypothetical protein [Verrucomicrobiota bacterium]MBT7067879.1 hypothetical protein [Verrucomicrobiota bacterium]MBT7701500.1 hypothetical protein [Verrucomicrobiota bacterium]